MLTAKIRQTYIKLKQQSSRKKRNEKNIKKLLFKYILMLMQLLQEKQNTRIINE